jgi:hypothetical protein
MTCQLQVVSHIYGKALRSQQPDLLPTINNRAADAGFLRGQTALHDFMALDDGQAAVPVAAEVLHLQGGRKVRTTSGASCVPVAQACLMLANCIDCKVRLAGILCTNVCGVAVACHLHLHTCTTHARKDVLRVCRCMHVRMCASARAPPPKTRTHTRVPGNPQTHSAWRHAHSPTHPQVRQVRRVLRRVYCARHRRQNTAVITKRCVLKGGLQSAHALASRQLPSSRP